MKIIKWRILFITCSICLLSVLLGVAVWDKLPDTIATHFDINNNPDGYSSKAFAVFGLPVLMVVLQIVCCIINDINAAKHGERKKFEYATKWIIPVMTILLQTATFGYALGWNIDIRVVATVIVGLVFLIIGNYLPKFDYIKNYNVDSYKARKINRFIGFQSVIMGILFLLSLFLPPVATFICIIFLIPYALIGVIYSVIIVKKK